MRILTLVFERNRGLFFIVVLKRLSLLVMSLAIQIRFENKVRLLWKSDVFYRTLFSCYGLCIVFW